MIDLPHCDEGGCDAGAGYRLEDISTNRRGHRLRQRAGEHPLPDRLLLHVGGVRQGHPEPVAANPLRVDGARRRAVRPPGTARNPPVACLRAPGGGVRGDRVATRVRGHEPVDGARVARRGASAAGPGTGPQLPCWRGTLRDLRPTLDPALRRDLLLLPSADRRHGGRGMRYARAHHRTGGSLGPFAEPGARPPCRRPQRLGGDRASERPDAGRDGDDGGARRALAGGQPRICPGRGSQPRPQRRVLHPVEGVPHRAAVRRPRGRRVARHRGQRDRGRDDCRLHPRVPRPRPGRAGHRALEGARRRPGKLGAPADPPHAGAGAARAPRAPGPDAVAQRPMHLGHRARRDLPDHPGRELRARRRTSHGRDRSVGVRQVDPRQGPPEGLALRQGGPSAWTGQPSTNGPRRRSGPMSATLLRRPSSCRGRSARTSPASTRAPSRVPSSRPRRLPAPTR